MSTASINFPSLKQIYRRLLLSLGPQHWWPAKTPFEVMVGAILTQGTNWLNVERAIARLKAKHALSAQGLANLRASRLQSMIRSTGYFRQKARRLQIFSRWYLSTYGANARRMFREHRLALRRQLLAIDGIGPETADSILLYAGHQPVVVVDGYTRRILRRHHLIDGDESYEAVQRLVTERLPEDARCLNEFHALLVAVGKRYCHRRDPDCVCCPLGDFPHELDGNNTPPLGGVLLLNELRSTSLRPAAAFPHGPCTALVQGGQARGSLAGPSAYASSHRVINFAKRNLYG